MSQDSIMASMATKIKRRPRASGGLAHDDDRASSSQPAIAMQDALRRHFESQFKPIEPPAPVATKIDEVGPASDEDEFSEWSGISESSGKQQIAGYVILC